MSRDYEHDAWIAWYVEDTAGWLELSLAARGAMAELARKLNRKGELSLRRGLPSLAVILRLRWEGELEPAMSELLASGKIVWDEALGLLSDPDYVARRRSNSADRMREKRSRDARSACDARDVTTVTTVTVTPVLVSSDLSGSDLSEARDQDPGLDPPTAALAPVELPVEAVSEVRRRAVGDDGDSGAIFGAWAMAIREVTGVPQTPLPMSERRELVAVANTHAGAATGQELLDWLRTTALAFARQHDPAFGGYTPVGLRKWLNGGRVVRAVPRGPLIQRPAAVPLWKSGEES